MVLQAVQVPPLENLVVSVQRVQAVYVLAVVHVKQSAWQVPEQVPGVAEGSNPDVQVEQ